MDKYHLIIRLLHWIVAVLVISMIVLTYNVGILPVEFKGQFYTIHKAMGLSVLFLMVVRVCVRVFTKAPEMHLSTSVLGKALNILARIVHFALYAVVISAPLSGYVMSSASGKPIKWFFDVDVPSIFEKNDQVASNARNIHLIIPIVIITLLFLHVLGFIKHLIVDKKNILKRIV